jgi:hypothetical protein
LCLTAICIARLLEGGLRLFSEEVLFIELKNRPGALAKAVEKLARARISIRACVRDRLVADEDDRRRGGGDGDLARALKMFP